MAVIQGNAHKPSVSGVVTQQSLKFNDDESQYLSWTPASAGNRKTWTWSGWVKRGNLVVNSSLFSAAGNYYDLRFTTSDTLLFYGNGSDLNFQTTTVYRDPSAWYHVVVALDTTQSTALDRVKIYVNGEQQTSFSSSVSALNAELAYNNTVAHAIGRRESTSNFYADSYLSDIHFIDGQALDASSFGETVDGYWKKKDYSGTYGTNGFRLTFQDDVVSEGFNTVTYRGNDATNRISGLGFSPDLVWLKNRDVSASNRLYNSLTYGGPYSAGASGSKFLVSNSTAAETTGTANSLISFDADGFSVHGSGNDSNDNGEGYVAWAWDAGSGSAASNTDGSITSSVKANPSYGFSIVSYTGNATAGATVGHGLSIKPSLVILKNRDSAYNWIAFTNAIDGSIDNLKLNLTDAKTDTTRSDFTTSVFELSGGADTNESGSDFIAYCFAEVAGYSSIGSYSGTGSSGNAVTTGFAPAFVMIKRTDIADSWAMFDNTRDTNNPNDQLLYAERSDAESTNTFGAIDFDSNGFTVNGIGSTVNNSGGTYIYMAFADTREAAFWKDVSGQGNHWTPNNLDYRDSLIDSPTNNFAVLNVLTKGTSNITLAEGNLKANAIASGSGSNWGTVFSSIPLPTTGKYYVEGLAFINAGAGNNSHLGVLDTSSFAPAHNNITYAYTTGEGFDGIYVSLFNDNAKPVSDGVLGTAEGSLTGTTVVAMLAVDIDNGKVWAGYNGTWLNSGNPSAGTNEIATRTFTNNDAIAVGTAYSASNAQGMLANFGQDSTFAGATTAGGNTDANGIGDFKYAPPSGYLALCTANLPTPSIVDGSEYFNTVLYTGTGAAQSITGANHAPDLLWIKRRDAVNSHILYDSVRGDWELSSNSTGADISSAGRIGSLDADGFTLENTTAGTLNASGGSYASWNWKAGGTAVSNTDGSITSQVSANTDAGFSIVSYTGTGSAGTIGHGLSSAPDMIIVKNRDDVAGKPWLVYHSSNTSAPETDYLLLNTSASTVDGLSQWNDTAPTSSVFSVGTSTSTNQSLDGHIAYCFANTDGYLKAGSYTGNGSTDGTFVYTGFKPAFVLFKGIDAAYSWTMYDSTRDNYNVVNKILYPSFSASENTGTPRWDFLSNGFKARDSGNDNVSGQRYIYLAFAENPFKYANAR